MLRNFFFDFYTMDALVLTSSLTALAQTAPITGKVQLQQADGTMAPAVGAIVELYRSGTKGKPQTSKTSKRGDFTFAGGLLGETYILSVSAPNATPRFFPNVKPGNTEIAITLAPGDGRRLTEEEVRQGMSAAQSSPAQGNQQAAATQQAAPANNAEAKKAEEEYNKKVAEVTAKNKKIEETDALFRRVLKEGNDAFNSKNYDAAVLKYDEAIAADPNHPSIFVFFNNKATTLRL